MGGLRGSGLFLIDAFSRVNSAGNPIVQTRLALRYAGNPGFISQWEKT